MRPPANHSICGRWLFKKQNDAKKVRCVSIEKRINIGTYLSGLIGGFKHQPILRLESVGDLGHSLTSYSGSTPGRPTDKRNVRVVSPSSFTSEKPNIVRKSYDSLLRYLTRHRSVEKNRRNV